MAMAVPIEDIRNGNIPSPPKLGEGVVKIVVIGERRVGKSRFIRSYYDHHEPHNINSHCGVRWYTCEFAGEGQYWRTAIFEIPSGPELFFGQNKPHYEEAKVIVFMYAVDDPQSLEMIMDKWIPETKDIILAKNIPAVLVGNKNDLRGNQQVIERLAVNNQEPVTYEQGEEFLDYVEILDFMEISSRNLEDVNRAFELIFSFIVYPV